MLIIIIFLKMYFNWIFPCPIILQVKSLSLIAQVLDDKNVRRRFRASNYQSTTRVKPFICTMPMRLDEGWNQIQFNLSDFTRRAYGTNYIETLRVQVRLLSNCLAFFSFRARHVCASTPLCSHVPVHTLSVWCLQIHANCRIRRVYFSDRLYSEDELPAEFKLYLPVQQKAPAAAGAPQAVAAPRWAEQPFGLTDFLIWTRWTCRSPRIASRVASRRDSLSLFSSRRFSRELIRCTHRTLSNRLDSTALSSRRRSLCIAYAYSSLQSPLATRPPHATPRHATRNALFVLGSCGIDLIYS